jgi:hypothetical protein
MDRQALTSDTMLVKSREMTGIDAKHCRGGWGWGRRGKDDRKLNTLAPLAEGQRELKRRKERSSSELTVVYK